MKIDCPTNLFTSNTENAFALSLKNGYHHLIDSVKVQISNNEVVNTQQLTNLKIHYDIVSTWTDDDVKTIGSVMNFCGIDNPDSENYQPAANAIGLGSCNNSIKQAENIHQSKVILLMMNQTYLVDYECKIQVSIQVTLQINLC